MIKSWMVIGGVAIVVALAINGLFRDSSRWFYRLQRPRWLTFEGLIPFIWTFIFICGVWSAVLVWEKEPGSRYTWLLMGLYLLLEIAIMAYTPTMSLLRSLKVGTVMGATGTFIGALLAVGVWPVSTTSAALLIPYLLWSPIGTYTTWAMVAENPGDA
jgi:tryptophan-rich sensory protein